ncbi:hypothetical protein ZOSMA_1G01590 [Zostera marina]|uniref:RING-type E3 ubiquitin transferase n=1 Tax=Zostera marina TaxID=29655 RepID=A0A0K9PPP9_ZOSMR|nr:hypothetical protein ZOSMA_1G01590 [Zostera marina]
MEAIYAVFSSIFILFCILIICSGIVRRICLPPRQNRTPEERIREVNTTFAQRIRELQWTSGNEPNSLPVFAVQPRFTYIYREVEEDGDGGGTPTVVRECVVCLSKVKGGEIVRVLPNCLHIFHVDCIDMWLSSHDSCPVCRAGILPGPPPVPTTDAPVVVPVEVAAAHTWQLSTNSPTSQQGG